ncbi:type IV pilus assembly protein PilM [Clostridium sp. D2Q-11]|uniref:Type IV pilus assembly protein PilM n=1 Tax=Anaeromonas frigoriresistens TaxID=2683708 RepID=A0A942UYM1_9FIRM|nr:type IV pilus assembly protein PilM [Anaeromonas frigoriresistens]MBS4540010.1 type IV pilus assembly protein PilM [Anaeromonas frigoriresistens]
MFSKKIISLDIGNENIKMLEVKQLNKNITLENAITINTPKNSIDDGNIMNIHTLSSYIKENLDKHGFKGSKGVITLDYPNVISREIMLPFAKEDELEEMVRYEIEQFLPIMLDDYVIDYRKREEFEEDSVKKLRLLVVAIPKKIVEGYMELLEVLDLDPYALDLNSNAVSKLIHKKSRINTKIINENDTLAFIDIGYKNININIISNYTSVFNRVIERGSRDIDIGLANAFNLELSEAKSKKEDFDLYEDNMNSYDIIHTLITAGLDEWISDIEKIFTYYRNINRGNKIDGIYIYGGGSRLKGLDKYLEEKLNIQTWQLKDIYPLRLGKKMKAIDTMEYLNNIGSIIRL